MATLKELSERTGYSPATISRILTGDTTLSVTAEVRKKVLEEAGRSNYSQTKSRRGRTPKIVLRVGMAERLTPAQQLNDPYYLYLGNYVRQGCIDRRYACVPLESRGERFALPREEALDGIVAIGRFSTAQIESLAALHPNVVFVDSSPFESRFDSVVPSYELGISLALEHLAQLGHRQLGFVGPVTLPDDRRQSAPEVRRELFLRLTAARCPGVQPLMLDCPMRVDATAAAWREHLRAGRPLPSAVLCANEENALGTLNALREEGLSVPGTLSVVSFNDTPRSALISPSLTSISINTQEMASAALRLLAERAPIGDRPAARSLPLKVIVPPSLVIRESTAQAR